MDAATLTRRRLASTGPCPFVDGGERCCEARFTLDRIDEAYAVCFGAHHGCEHFHRLRRAEAEAEEGTVFRPVVLTITGMSGTGLERTGHERRVADERVRSTGT